MTAHQELLAPDLGGIEIPPAAVEVGIHDHLVVVAHGKPQQKGDLDRGWHGKLYDKAQKPLDAWRVVVGSAAREAVNEMHPDAAWPLFPKGTPVHLGAVFTFERPAAHYGTGRNAHALKASAPREHCGTPDLDKLMRGVLDLLTACGAVWQDDKQVCRFLDSGRFYPGGHRDALPTPGVVIRIRAVAP